MKTHMHSKLTLVFRSLTQFQSHSTELPFQALIFQPSFKCTTNQDVTRQLSIVQLSRHQIKVDFKSQIFANQCEILAFTCLQLRFQIPDCLDMLLNCMLIIVVQRFHLIFDLLCLSLHLKVISLDFIGHRTRTIYSRLQNCTKKECVELFERLKAN